MADSLDRQRLGVQAGNRQNTGSIRQLAFAGLAVCYGTAATLCSSVAAIPVAAGRVDRTGVAVQLLGPMMFQASPSWPQWLSPAA